MWRQAEARRCELERGEPGSTLARAIGLGEITLAPDDPKESLLDVAYRLADLVFSPHAGAVMHRKYLLDKAARYSGTHANSGWKASSPSDGTDPIARAGLLSG